MATAVNAAILACETEGEVAGRDGQPFDACPYTFARAGVDQWTFDAEWRSRLDAWFRGWNRTRPVAPMRPHPRWHKERTPAQGE